MGESPAPTPGVKLGDRRVRVDRPHTRYFRYTAPGVVSAKLAAHEPATPAGVAVARARHALLGHPISSEDELAERLPKWKALAVFSSDVMSSVAYATEASMFTLLAVGTVAFVYLMPISLLIVGLLFLVTFSYRQTIRAYPSGGGSYIVAHANLGTLPGLVAAAALLTDYVLTVAVSVSSGVFNLASAFPLIQDWTVPIIVALIFLVMAVNLRGVRESGSIFALPTYIFIVSVMLLVATGLARTAMGQPPHVTGMTPITVPVESLSLLLLMRAFADGCSAMTGTEAISNGTPAFKPPEWKNAQMTMVTMAVILGVVFLGISYLATVSGAVPTEHVSVLAQIGAATFGEGPIYYVLILSTMGILVLAAQTSFADFPRLSSILARDGFMPRQFAFRGERLSFNAGIVALAVIASVVVIAFRGRVEALIPLYAIGVFTAFTLSQLGMVRHWLTERAPGWRRSAIINGLGATATAIVVVVFAIAKFALGAWIIIIVVPILVVAMLLVKRTYDVETHELAVRSELVLAPPDRERRVIVAAPALSRAVIQAIQVGRGLSPDVSVVHVTSDVRDGERVRDLIERAVPGIDVVIVESPYRNLVRPFVRYLEILAEEDPGRVTMVLIPELVPRHWWERLLFNQNGRRIASALIGREDVIVLDAPYRRAA